MKFSTKSSYGLRAMIALAKNYRQGSLSLSIIARTEGISLGYLERLMAKLKKQGLVESAAGVKGGYTLAKTPSKVTIREILETLEGSIAPFRCAEIACNKKDCLAQKVWQRLDKEVKKTLNKMTLKDLIS